MKRQGLRSRRNALVGRLRKARHEALERIGDRPNVVGSMIGLKYRAGERTARTGLTILVREKIPEADLSPRERVPRTIRTHDGTLATDVVVWKPMVEQGLEDATILHDGSTNGTLTCFGQREDSVFGVSCAHCLAGVDRNPATPTTITMYSPSSAAWQRAGKSVYAVYSPGPAMPGDFGYIDCGLFSLRDEALAERAINARPLRAIRDLRLVLDTDVFGVSALAPEGWESEPGRVAHVVGIEQDALDGSCDLVLEVSAPGTFRGDSGMLWLTEDGRAAGIHARGERVEGGGGSRLVTAMSAARAAAYLQVQLARA